MSMSIFNDDIHNTRLNITINLEKPIENIFSNIQIRLPESDTDRNFEKIFFTTDVDFSKLVKGVRGNYIISILYNNLAKSMDFDLKFPMKAVSSLEFI